MSAGVASILVVQDYATKNWAAILIAIGLVVPPVIVGWIEGWKRKSKPL